MSGLHMLSIKVSITVVKIIIIICPEVFNMLLETYKQ